MFVKYVSPMFLLVFMFGCSISKPELTSTSVPNAETREAEKVTRQFVKAKMTRESYYNASDADDSDSTELSNSDYSGPMKWEYTLPYRKITLIPPLSAGTVLKITGARWDGSGHFSIWGLDEDQVKSELVMNTTKSRDVENVRLRNDVYYFEVESDPKGKWTIEIEKLP
jgi:hypothetical protein